jgi:selenide,water dikinase
LDKVLGAMPRIANPNVLVGFETADDAGVYRLTPDLALVQTIDFFTPIVDDPFTFGAIAAANALSDIYAMGGTPLSSLAVVAFPPNGDPDVLESILRGGVEKMSEAGCAVIGGHSVADPELKFGYAVTGKIHPDRVKTNSGARPADVVLFTKAIGTGVIGTALKRGIAEQAAVDAAIASMLTLNRAACEAMLHFDVHGCTDVTGFGLLGHAREMAVGSHVTIEIESAKVPLLPGALDAVRAGATPGGLANNREFVSSAVATAVPIDPALLDLLYDPQTSGGLLISMPETDAARMEVQFPAARRIGRILPRDNKPILLR